MSTFKEIKNKITSGLSNKSEKTPNDNLKETDDTELKFDIEESRYLLSLIAKSDFSGKDVQIVYNIALKLQKSIERYLKKDE